MSVRSRSEMEHARTFSAWAEITATTSGITSLGTGGTAVLRYRRRGTEADVRVRITLGTGGGGGSNWQVALPSGWAATSGTNDYQAGWAMFNDTGTVSVDGRCYVQPGGTSLVLVALNVAGTFPSWTNVTGTVPFTWTATDFLVAGIRLELAS